MANIRTKAQRCENAVSTKALARRDPYPPAKSAAPHRNTAVTLNPAGASWVREDTPDEGNTRVRTNWVKGDHFCETRGLRAPLGIPC